MPNINIVANVKIAKNYLDSLIRDFDFDVYDYIKDEVNLGLFSRITRLYVILLEYPNLWTKDLGGIILRCLVDTAITFSYLIRYGIENEYEEFIAYGEGKEKLLMLHIQDTYPEEKSLNNQGVEQIANNLGGGFTPELIDINLSFWTSISARDMAKKTNFEKYYRLIYDPTSADIHGTWFSLKSANLTRCTLALHRYHRIPNYYEPLINIGYCNIGQEIYIQCIKNGIKYLNFPKDVKFKKLSL